ncbi:MAG: lytic transglycosylase domain-containing protein [Antarcticimicrobium sp.]|uniref:lytic transglycosylase domain-containing protein n=1 Tax=Antarcticimicrobium sp. TaxID=2824147 RepID=UPI002634C24F|nr:lytic transglycosylase domain-containing protein [Antarcticimicrobium sp.]MDF1717325.1 lytic transglycosylase domain-containing protein [Antarcticimicrobium sp.]
MQFRDIGAAALVLACAVLPAGAEAPAPYPEFQAKRVRPPAPGTARRITVQIDPEEQAARLAAAPPPVDPAPKGAGAPSSPGRYDWFWQTISPDLAEASPGRLQGALQLLSGAQEVAAPRLQALQEIARARGIPILTATVGTRVSPALVLAVIAVESGGRPDAVSGAGAQGLMQLMPDTATRFGVTDSLAPDDNIAGGVKYLDWLMERFGNDPILVLAGYNAGEGSVANHGGVPPFAETRDYVPKVLAAFQVARGLCLTPPELISDGCVFNAMD